MGISVTQHDDGSITVECGHEKLTIYPRVGGFDWNPPIPTGPGPRVSVIVPIGGEPSDGPELMTIPWTNSTRFSKQLQEMLGSRSTASTKEASMVNVRIRRGTKLAIGEILSSANRIAKKESIPVHVRLTSSLLKK